jgi:hypothetical protein
LKVTHPDKQNIIIGLRRIVVEKNQMFALVRSLDAMLSKTQQRYIIKLCEAGKDIVSVPLWSEMKGAEDLTNIGEGLVFMEWSERNQYVVRHLS